MKITSIVRIEWEVEDPVYPYQGMFEYSLDQLSSLSKEVIQQKQETEYNDWVQNMKSIEQGQ